jgi:uncharacterized protein (AIM24 family)
LHFNQLINSIKTQNHASTRNRLPDIWRRKYVEIELDPQEIVIAEAGSFMMMDNNIQMETIFGDGSEQQSGLFGKL